MCINVCKQGPVYFFSCPIWNTKLSALVSGSHCISAVFIYDYYANNPHYCCKSKEKSTLVCLVRCCRFKLFCHQQLKLLIRRYQKWSSFRCFQCFNLWGFRVDSTYTPVYRYTCIHVYVCVCACKRKDGKRKRCCALAFSSSPFLVAGDEKGAVDNQHRAFLKPKFQYRF